MRYLSVPAVLAALLLAGLPVAGPVQAADTPSPAPTVADARTIALTALKAMLQGTVDDAYRRFDDGMRQVVSLDDLRAMLAKELASRGPVTGYAEPRTQAVKDFTVVQIVSRFEKGRPLQWSFTLRPDGRIAGLNYAAAAAPATQSDIERAIAAIPGRISVAALVAESPATSYFREADRPMGVASQFKVLFLADAAERLAAGTWKADQRLEITPRTRSFPSGILHRFDPGLRPTLNDLLSLMISDSDNTATDTVLRALGRDHVTERMQAWAFRSKPVLLSTGQYFALAAGFGGLPSEPQARLEAFRRLDGPALYRAADQAETELAIHRGTAEAAVGIYIEKVPFRLQAQIAETLDWKLTARELADFYRRVSTGQFQSPAVSGIVDRYLGKGGRGMIGGALRQDERVVRVARKGGSDRGILTDGGYLTTKDGRHVVIVVLANGLPEEASEDKTAKQLADVSQLVFEYLQP